MRFRYLVVLLSILSVTVGWAAAQSIEVDKVAPTIIAGENLGFLVEGRRGATPVGRIVVKVDGRWVLAELGSGATLLSQR